MLRKPLVDSEIEDRVDSSESQTSMDSTNNPPRPVVYNPVLPMESNLNFPSTNLSGDTEPLTELDTPTPGRVCTNDLLANVDDWSSYASTPPQPATAQQGDDGTRNDPDINTPPASHQLPPDGDEAGSDPIVDQPTPTHLGAPDKPASSLPTAA